MNRKKKIQRVLSLVLALTFILSGSVVAVSAEDTVLSSTPAQSGNSSVTTSTIDDVREILDSESYDEYREDHSTSKEVTVDGVTVVEEVWMVAPGESEIVIDAIEALDEENTDAEYKIETYDGVKALYTPAQGTVSWKVSIPKEARYIVVIECYPVDVLNDGTKVSKDTSVERIFRINSTVPFLESRYINIPKRYTNDYVAAELKVGAKQSASELLAQAKAAGFTATELKREDGTYIIYEKPDVWTQETVDLSDKLGLRFFSVDIDDNEIRPLISQDPVWSDYEIHDVNGYYAEPFQFVFEASESTSISLTAVNEPLAIKSIRLVPYTETSSYEEVKAGYPTASAGSSVVRIEGEYPTSTSSQTIYPMEDTRSAITKPISTKHTFLNGIGGVGGDKWQNAGQTITYKFSVSESGMYNIVARFSQSTLDGMYSSRALSIFTDYTADEYKRAYGDLDGYYNGVPFAEASALRFDYSSKWQTKILSDGVSDFEFYFEAGVEYTISMAVTLGSMGSLVSKVENALEAINADYLNILKLTGAEPDDYRDYGFKRIMPDTVEDLAEQGALLYELVDELQAMSGVKGSMAATLEKVAWLLEKMGKDPEGEIAKNLSQFKSYIGSLGTWISDAKNQPLQFDYLQVQGVGSKVPKAEANFFQSFGHEISSFFQSFVRNYDRMGTTELIDEDDEAAIDVWLAYGRDQTQVIRNLVNNDFTPESGVPVNLKLVAGGTLLPSILAKSGPDVYIGVDQASVINYAIRGALLPVEDYEGFNELCIDETTRQFNEAAMMVLGIEDAAGEMHYYGLPETQTFNMMFVRKDILAELDLDIPKTWDDILAAIPVLQANNMQIGMHSDYKIFLYQMGGELFADGGMRINLDSNTALDAFEFMCSLYTNYSFPYTYDFPNRFRTGEMPIGFASYTDNYNKLKVFATEIEGLWGMYPMPGTEDEYGNINNCSVSTATAIVMITGCKNTESAWEFMKWHSGKDCQEKYSNEMVAILGPSAKHPTANTEALEGLPWSVDELREIKLQFNNLASIPNYPGSYILTRYTDFAFLAAYNNGENPVDELLSYITTINKEIDRKRSEFDLETLDYVGQKLSEKRMLQALRLLEDGKISIEGGEAYTNNKGESDIRIVTTEYTISDGLKKTYANVFDTIIAELTKITDAENTVEESVQMETLLGAIEQLKTVKPGASDEKGVAKAIEFLTDAYDALISYQK